MENFDLKVKYDTQLDNLFFSKDFKWGYTISAKQHDFCSIETNLED